MDARQHAWAVALFAMLSLAARYPSANFVVTAPSPEMAQQVGEAAEKYRREIANDWLGYVMPDWSRPCPVTVRIERGAGGVTTFNFARGEVFGWNMSVQGPLDQIIESVLPHEVTHTIFASHFRQPLPRWADEGACTTVESPNERGKQNKMLVEFLRTGRGIAFPHMFRMKEYPRDVLPLYAQGHSLSTFLIGQKGKHEFVAYIAAGLKADDWAAVTQQRYGFRGLAELQNAWLDWVEKGSPGVDFADTSIVMRLAAGRVGGKHGGSIYRGQSPETAGQRQMGPVRATDAVDGNSRAASDHVASVPRHGNDAGGESKGWHAPGRTATAPFSQSESVAATGGERLSQFAGSSRYDRAGVTVAATQEPAGRHLPDAPRQAVPSRGGFNRSGGAPPQTIFAPAQPFMMQPSMQMPCVGGS